MTINGCVNKTASIEKIHVFLTINNIKFYNNIFFFSFSIAYFEKLYANSYYKDVSISIQKTDSMHIFHCLYLFIYIFLHFCL